MKTLRQVLELSRGLLQREGVSSSRRVAEEIISSALHISRMELYLHFDRDVAETEWRRCQKKLDRKITGEPVEHILKVIDFFHNKIEVHSSALIPRQESEILLQKVSDIIRGSEKEGGILLDLCTGTGCLGLGLKRSFPSLDVYLSDISTECLNLANRNSRRNGLDVTLLQGDLFTPFSGRKADYFICNPPYISKKDFDTLDSSVKNYEPSLALLGGESGLEFYQRIEKALPEHLNPGAQIFFEIGYDQGSALMEIFGSSCWKSARCEKDWAGHDRFFFLEFQPSPC